jgi:single-stranded-DNA-specific exonuclease
MAAGFTVEAARLGELRDFLARRIAEAIGDRPLVPELGLDGAVALGGASEEFCERLERLAPFGAGNAEPRFAIPGIRIVRADVVGGSHVRCVLADPVGGARLKGIAFRCVDGELGAALLRSGASLHVAGHLRVESWQGQRNVQLAIEDAAPAL